MTLTLICAVLLAMPAEGLPVASNPAYQAERAKTGRSSEEQVKLALWCEAHGLTAERLHHLTLAILADPKNATARGLMGLVSHAGRWQRPEVVADKAKADAVLAEYEAKRLKSAYTADAQWTLGLWAAEHGLTEQAKAHWSAVVRLDPSRDLAWKKLGYKKHDGRWATDAQLAQQKMEAEAQKAADRKWKPILDRYKAMLDQPLKREEAEAALADVSDPRAVPSIVRVFLNTHRPDLKRGVQLLGQVDSPSSSRLLAVVAALTGSSDVRRVAVEILKQRDPREFAGLLISMLSDPIKYEVKPVGGPGSPGSLFVEGKKYNVQRMYSPPSFSFAMMPGDIVTRDADGLPVVYRDGGTNNFTTQRITGDKLLAMIQSPGSSVNVSSQIVADLRSPAFGLSGGQLANLAMVPQRVAASDVGTHLESEIARVAKAEHKAPSGFGFVLNGRISTEYEIPVGQMMAETQRATMSAQQQLASDVATLDAYNESVRKRNEVVGPILASIAGKDLGREVKPWKDWFVDQLGYANRLITDTVVPTMVENVPLAYQPQSIPITTNVTGVTTGFTRMSCFGAGTAVRTVDGVRPIESLKVGDLVLTQSTGNGALGYKPILFVHHNPPSATFRIKLGDDSIISSHFHRFWVAGRGWVMARDLKAGDRVRTLGGVMPVEAVEADKVQLVYNLDVAEDADFFAGKLGALVHDNTLPDNRLAPFDATQAPAGVVGKAD